MTDAEKIKGVLDLFNIEIAEAPGSFKAAGKRFFPDKNGEIAKVTFKWEGNRYTATPEGVL